MTTALVGGFFLHISN